MEPFKPSINWGHALTDSLSWVALAWLISAVCVIVVLVLLRSLTPWGQQFWRITGGYFVGRHSVPVWSMLGVLLLSVVVAVRLNVLFSYQSNDLASSIQTAVQGLATGNDAVKQSGEHGFWMSILIFSVMAVVQITVQTEAGPRMLGTGAAMVQFSRSVGAAFGTATVAAILFSILAVTDRDTASLFGAIIDQGPEAIAALPAARQAIVQSEIADAFRSAFLTIALFTTAGTWLAWSMPLRRI